MKLILRVIDWLISAMMLLFGIGVISNGGIFSGIIMLLIAVVFNPLPFM